MAEIVSFGEWVQIRRETLRLTRRQLADSVACSPVTIKKIERDERRPSRQIAKLLAEHLDIPASDRDAFLRWARGEFVTNMPAPDGTGQTAMVTESQEFEEDIVQIPHNLPIQSTPFIGREEELDTLDTLLVEESQRLVTIVGPGGMGKTRLALASAGRFLTASSTADLTTQTKPRFPQGIFFIDLTPLSESDQIAATVAKALDFQPPGQGPVRGELLNYLRRKRLLLLLDNFEHLLDGADFVVDILEAAPAVQILVTSRERLHLQAEQVYPIEGLEFPDWETPEDAAEYTAVQLFLQSARRNQPDFALISGDDLTYLARICRLVAGMPLAIELAAAWVDTLSLKKIAIEIQQNLDFLETDMRDVPDRHRSLRAAIDGSWQKLTREEQTIFAQLSVFRGGFTRKAGQAVAHKTTGKAASLPLLSRLVNKSFLRFNQKRERFQIHEMLRQFGADKLAKDEVKEAAVRDRHSYYYCQTLYEKTEDLKGSRQKEALIEMVTDCQNIYQAWIWAANQKQIVRLEQAIFSLVKYYGGFKILPEEGRRAFKTAISNLADISNPEATLLRAKLMAWRVLIHFSLGEKALEQTTLESLQLIDDVEKSGIDVNAERALAFWAVGTAIWRQEPERAQKMYKQSLEIWRQLKDPYFEAKILRNLGILAIIQDQDQKAQRLFQKALAINKKINNLSGIAGDYLYLGVTLYNEQEYVQSIQNLQESLSIHRDLGFRYTVSGLLRQLGFSLALTGQTEKAFKSYQESLSLSSEIGSDYMVALALSNLSWLNILVEEFAESKRQIQMLQNLREPDEVPYDPLVDSEALVSLCKIAIRYNDYQLASEHAKKAVDIMSASSFRQSSLLNAQIWLSWSQLALEKQMAAEVTILKILPGTNKLYLQEALQPLAYLLAQRAQSNDEKEKALALTGLYEATFPLAQYPFYQQIAEQFLPENLAVMPSSQVEAAKAHGRGLDLAETVADLQAWLPTIGWGQPAAEE